MKKCLVFLYAITFLLGIVSISGAKSVLFSSKNLFYYNINHPQSYHCYGGDLWSTMTSILDAATGNDVHVVPDFENLDQMLNYDALFVCLRSRYIDPPLTAIEVNNISRFIETGRRVVLVGENPFWTSWNEIILGIVGGSLDPFTPNWYGTYGTGFTSYSIVENYLTNGVDSIYCTGSLAIGGTELFDYAVATLWGDNVLSVLTTNVFEEGALNYADNKQFATNIANWIAYNHLKDFILTANQNQTIDLRLSNGDGTFQPPVEIGESVGVNYAEFAIADFTGDGRLDFIASTNENPARLYLFTRTGPTSFQQDFLTTLDSDPKAAYYLNGGNDPLRAPDYGNGLIAADLDIDGDMDFLENINHDFRGNKSWIAKGNAHLNGGSGNFTRVADAFDFSAPDNIYTGWTLGMSSTMVDVDGDGYPDMLASEQSCGGTVSSKVYLLKGNGNGTFQGPVHVFTTDHHPATHMTLGDFNNDGKVDAIVGQDDDGDPGAAFLFLAHGDGTFEQTGIEAFDTRPDKETGSDEPGHGRYQAYDADHDGILDIISAAGLYGPNVDELDAELLFFHGRGDGSFEDGEVIDSNILTTTAFVAPLTSPLDVKVRGDLDGDRDVDYDDYLIFRTAYRSCSGDDNFLPAADLDGDGCVTINDYRILRTLM